MQMRFLVTGAIKKPEKLLSFLENETIDYDFLKNEKDKVDNPEIYDGVICNNIFLYNKIESFLKLKFVQITSAGVDRVPISYISTNNIFFKNAKGVYSIPIAEYVISTILCYYKRIPFFLESKKNHIWEKKRDIEELNEKKVLIVGCGSIGNELAKRFKSFNCFVCGVDTAELTNINFNKIYDIKSGTEVFGKFDIIVSCLPLSNDTFHFFNKNIFDKFLPNSIFVNISRGGVVKQSDLVEYAKTNKSFIILDVFEEEPLEKNNVLWNLDNVFITPHNSFESCNNSHRLNDLIIKNIKQWMAQR